MANHHHLTRAIEVFMDLDRGLTLFQMYAFLLVATNEGQTQKWVEEKLKTSNATASRTIAKWMEHERKGKAGLNMIRQEEDIYDRRYRILTLTPEGRKLMQRVRKALGDEDDGSSSPRQMAG